MQNREDEESKTDILEIRPLMYYKNPEIGVSRSQDESPAPVQIVYPGGSLAIGLAVNRLSTCEENRPEIVPAVVVSGPENSVADIGERNGIKVAFVILAIVNLVVTCLMFFDAQNVDISNSTSASSNDLIQVVFESIPSSRSTPEKVNFTFTIIIIIWGTFSVLLDSVIGLSAYSLGCLLNMLLGSASLPLYVYSFRYVFDIALLYFALVQRSKLMFTFLPTHIHGQ